MLIAPSLALVLAAAPAAAKIFTARPANSTVGKGGEPFRLSWMDDGEEPTLATIGPVRIDLCVGTGEKNVVVQEVAPAVDLSKQSNLTFTVDPKAGENGQYYFFKYTAADNVMGQAYSQLTARFFMTSMTGDWSSEQEALVASVSTAALPTETANTANTAHTNGAPTAVSATPSATTSAPTSAALAVFVPVLAAAGAGAVALFVQ